MSTSKPLLPFYQTIEGIPFPGLFSAEAIHSALKYKAKPRDFFIVTYPKCGTTWAQVIVYLIHTRGRPAQNSGEFFKRMPFLESSGTEALTDQVLAIKIHLPVDKVAWSPEAKYLCVTRNPKDVVVSFFHHTKSASFLFQDGEFNVFFDLFMEGKVEYGDYFDNVLGWYERRHESNVLFLTYEELKKDIRSSIMKIAHFMGEEHTQMLENDPNILEDIVKYSSVDHMKTWLNEENLAADMSLTKEDVDAMPLLAGKKHMLKFLIDHRTPSSKYSKMVRKGIVGDWRQMLSTEQNDRLNEKIKERLKDTELYNLWKNIM